MNKMSYVVTFLSASLFILFLAVTGAQAEACKPPGTGPGFGRLDFVNIGTEEGPYREKAHQAAGWGPIEPNTHGGNWGNIGGEQNCDLPNHKDCDGLTRVTWAGECLDFSNELYPEGINGCLDPAGTGSPFAYDPPTTFEPDSFALYGRAARVVVDPNALVGHGGKARQLRMRVLDGIGYDAFEVFVRNIKKINGKGQIPAKPQGDTAVLVYRFDPYAPENIETKISSTGELWRVHTIDLTAYDGQLNLHSEPNALEVIIQATAAPWGLFYKQNGQGGYGQLAVDWIELLGTPKKPVKN